MVARDHVVRLGPRVIAIPPGPQRRSYARCRVEVRELLDGRVVVFTEQRLLACSAAPDTEFTLVPRRSPRDARPRRQPAPPPRPRGLTAALRTLAASVPTRAPSSHVWRRVPFSRAEQLRQRARG